MARVPAFTTSLAIHAAAFAALVVLPVFGPDRLPEVEPPSKPPLTLWPASPPVVLADSRPLRAPSPAGAPRRASNELAAPLPPAAVAPTQEPESLPADEGLLDSPGSAFATASFASGDGTGELPGTGTGTGTAIDGGPGAGGGELHRVGGDLRPPTKVRHVTPEYPELARRARVQGTVILECTIDTAGQVIDARVISGHPLLAPAALEAVRRWSYVPTRLNGQTVSVLMTVSVRFTLGS